MNNKTGVDTHSVFKADEESDFYVVGLGASAGGLDALNAFLSELEPTKKVSYIVAQHLSPTHESKLSQLLENNCRLKVVVARSNVLLNADKVYVTPPGKTISIRNGRIHLTKNVLRGKPKPSIDHFFKSLSDEFQERSVAVILSGTGSDGALGCREIKSVGGLVYIQSDESCEFNSMPRSALKQVNADLVATPAMLAKQFISLIKSEFKDAESDDDSLSDLQALLDVIQKQTHTDFTCYKDTTLRRQLKRRMLSLKINEFADYLDLVDNSVEEAEEIKRRFLVSVTDFFRDPDVFVLLKKKLIALVSRKKVRDDIRIWVPACATGEEVYSIAILLMEILGRRINEFEIKIYGTDADLAATERARTGLFDALTVENIPGQIVQRYFVKEGKQFRITKPVRDLCVFARQNVIQDHPFLRMDLISCRNMLIYFQARAQSKVLNTFHYALARDGLLLLGRSETPNASDGLFKIVDSSIKLFCKKNVATPANISIRSKNHSVPTPGAFTLKQRTFDAVTEANHFLVSQFSPVSVLLDQNLVPIHFFGDVSPYFQLPTGAVDFNVLSLAKESIRIELSALIRKSKSEDFLSEKFLFSEKNKNSALNVSVKNIVLGDDTHAVLISFEPIESQLSTIDSSKLKGVKTDEYRKHIHALEDELQGSREHLQTVIEELETSNEELQSLNEELRASSEELQASNEELETTNEELQASNEELTTVNDELQFKTDELGLLNTDLSNIQDSIHQGLVVVDQNFNISRYNNQSIRIFGIVPDDVGQSIFNVPTSVDVPDFKQKLNNVIRLGDAIDFEVSRDEQYYLVRIMPYITEFNKQGGAVITFADISELKYSERHSRVAQENLQFIADNMDGFVWMSDVKREAYNYVSAGFEKIWKRPLEALKNNAGIWAAGIHPNDLPKVVEYLKQPPSEPWDVIYRVVREGKDDCYVRDRGKQVTNDHGEGVISGSVIDVTRRMKAESHILINDSRFKALFENTVIGVCILNPEGVMTKVSTTFAQWLGYETDELTGAHFSKITHPDDIENESHHLKAVMEMGKGSQRIEKRYLSKDKKELWARVTMNIPADKNPLVPPFCIKLVEDITDLRLNENRLYQQSNFDKLTKLPNRTQLNVLLAGQMLEADKSHVPLYVMFLDMDGFKDVNDSLGHNMGDQVLLETAQRLAKCLHSRNVLARFGGDEFVMLVGQVDSIKTIDSLCQDILRKLEKPFSCSDKKLRLSGSIGVCQYPLDATGASQLIQNSDNAMHRAKEKGGNCYSYYSESMYAQAVARSETKHDLKKALEENQFLLHYQPVYECSSQKVTSAEVLIRWNNPEKGMVPPNDFIPFAEHIGLISRIDEWVFEHACEMLEKWRKQYDQCPHLSINVSAPRLVSKSFVNQLLKWQHLLSHVTVEVTERLFLENLDEAERALKTVRKLGAKISLDDFGTGYSSLEYLQRFPFDIVKIDQSFVSKIGTTKRGDQFVHAIVAVAMAVNADVVAEGVETVEQQTFIEQFERTYIQGYLRARPMPEDAYGEFIENLTNLE